MTPNEEIRIQARVDQLMKSIHRQRGRFNTRHNLSDNTEMIIRHHLRMALMVGVDFVPDSEPEEEIEMIVSSSV